MALHKARCAWRKWRDPTFMEEDLIPQVDGAPDLRGFRKPLESYVEMHARWAGFLAEREASPDEAARAYKARTYGQWGFIAKGAKAVPYAVSLLDAKEPDFREDAAGILTSIGKNPLAVAALLRTAEKETDPAALSGFLQAFGRMKVEAAVPIVARALREGDADTRWDAAEALGRIAGKRFGDGPDRVERALAWLEELGRLE